MPNHIEKLKVFFEEYGWKAERLDENTIVSGFAGENSTFTLFVKATDEWVILSISQFVEHSSESYSVNFLKYLARLNFHATPIKFSIDDKNNVVLTVELPSDNLTFHSFEISLDALCFYADDQYQTILNLARDPGAVPPPFIESSLS